jgi:hypothetical protein
MKTYQNSDYDMTGTIKRRQIQQYQEMSQTVTLICHLYLPKIKGDSLVFGGKSDPLGVITGDH